MYRTHRFVGDAHRQRSARRPESEDNTWTFDGLRAVTEMMRMAAKLDDAELILICPHREVRA